MRGRPPPHSISATELSKLGLCEHKIRLDAVYGAGRGSARQEANKERGRRVHDSALTAAVRASTARPVDRRCFIATAIYGADATETSLLRAWRDTILMRSRLGRISVHAYYVMSPMIVQLIQRFPRIGGPIRSLLDCVVRHVVVRGDGP